ncbi:helix-turn-helix domain-containing protein [Lactococcus garvieae]|uniref:helix-turn-helix domain-containing protein n=1 Tax=Lactococcus garvieae TaxID=1363 RepID=UPI001F615F96|nr:helix-turn-helix domain-containing protein [Lactococcus garvieae]MCI3861551.1 helix-turn-helix domain-containing protein [Lactococcus garvieae]
MEIKALNLNVSLELLLLDTLRLEERWMSTEELSCSLKISRKKTENIIASLTHKIKIFNSEQLILKTARGQGNQLLVESNKVYIDFRRSIIENTLIYKIIFSIMFKKNSNIVSLALENFVSESLVQKKIYKANEFLKDFGVKIGTRKQELKFIGDENQIRILIQNLLWRLYRGEEWPFYQVNEKLLKKIIYKFSESLNLKIEEITCNKITYILAINYIRFKKGETIDLSNITKRYSKLCLWVDSKTQIYNTLKMEFDLSKSEIDFFILHLITQKDIYERLGNPDSILKNTPADIATELLIKKYNNEFGRLTAEETTIFYKNIYPCHLYANLFSNLVFSETAGYYGLNIVSQYLPIMKKTIEKMLYSLYIGSGMNIFLNHKYLLTEYLLTFSEFTSIVGKEKKVTILIDTDASKVSEQFLINQIKNRFSDLYNLELVTNIEKTNNNVDLVISTTCLNDKQGMREDVQCFIIHLFPTQKEFDYIENYLKLLIIKNTK